MFWGYTPALDLLREYFWWRGKEGGADFGVVGSGRPTGHDHDPTEAAGGVTITEITGEDVEGLDADVHEGHVQEDNAADDGGGGVVGELLLPGGGAAPETLQAAGLLRGQDDHREHAGERCHRAGGQQGPVPREDGAHDGGHVHLDGAVGVQQSDRDARRQRDDPVRPGQRVQLLPPPLPPGQDHPGNAVHRPEVEPERSGGAGDSFDLFRVDSAPADSVADEDTLNILLVGSLDSRHVLKTLSCLHRHADALGGGGGGGGSAAGESTNKRLKVRFFVAETVMELVARQLLFILAALEPPDRLGRTEKARLLLELMGNALVRPGTALWLRRAARLLVDLVTDEAALRARLPLVDLSHLRHRDRDRLEEVLAFYQERPQSFRVGYHWDQRLRRHLGARYDNRAGAFDWDYFMALRDLQGGDRVCVHEYRQWRETGVAFTWLEAEQSEPNLTLAAGIVREGSRLLHGGYLGDIVTSPFIAYAVELEPEDAAEVFRKANDQYVTRSTDAAERHLNRIAFELQHQSDFQPSKEHASAAGGVVLSRVTDESRLDPRAPPEDDDDTLRKVQRAADMLGYDPLPVDNAQVVFLSPKFLLAPVEGRARFAGRFQAAVLGQGLGERQLDAALRAVLAPGAVVLVEGPRFLLQRADARRQSAEDMLRRARGAGLTPLKDFDVDKDDYAKFVVDAG